MTNKQNFEPVPTAEPSESWMDSAVDGRLNVDDPRFAPNSRECLPCYLKRMLKYGCARHQFTQHYQRIAAPRATQLLKRLKFAGGCCCECEVLFNVYALNTKHFIFDDDEEIVGDFPDCKGVRKGSAQACDLWLGGPR